MARLQQLYMEHWANPQTRGQAKADWDQYLKAAQAWQTSAAAGNSPNTVLPPGEEGGPGPGSDLHLDAEVGSTPSGASGASTGTGAAEGEAAPSGPSTPSGAPSAPTDGKTPSTPTDGKTPSTPSGGAQSGATQSGPTQSGPTQSGATTPGDTKAEEPKTEDPKAKDKDPAPGASGQYPSPDDLRKYGPLKQDEPKLEPTKDSGKLSPGYGSFSNDTVYTPGSKEFVSLFTAAAKEAGVPASWATDPVLGQIVNHESGGRVGIPNYTYQAQDSPERWKEIRQELLDGKCSAKSTPSPVNGAMTEGATNTGLGQLKLFRAKQFYPDGARGIGDAYNEAVGM
ncbi:MAG TPA: hypothetical protein VFH51_08475, partial [Myxococcota bacterium]|nr:hypothetical protein [Myxococcota bacterium]